MKITLFKVKINFFQKSNEKSKDENEIEKGVTVKGNGCDI